ncbi:MAG: nucleotidyltransferase domain-containing protein [Thermodesulfobacteriota bacterium]|nr:nucleotidyltransferase domain-containing protein [Thermodesulfobacteriota bacterium]
MDYISRKSGQFIKTVEKEIIELIDEKGPLTGAEIMDAVDDDALNLWRTCRLSKKLTIRIVGYRYLRLDRRIEGFARLSPSILREFLTYSVIGSLWDQASIIRKTYEIALHIEEISRAKSELAHSISSALASRLENELPIKDQVCFIIGGDIVYNMAHDVPRPERSTGKLVKGSDVDLVVIVDDTFPKKSKERLDEAIYKEKYRLLITPHLREEIDYIVKNLDRVREQVRFDTFRHMVACKILREGTLLYGSDKIFHMVKSMLMEHGVIEKLDHLEKRARAFRKKAEDYLLSEDPSKIKEESLYLFYPTEESEEFE